jgi:heterokaryon incompatibility protein (HET)
VAGKYMLIIDKVSTLGKGTLYTANEQLCIMQDHSGDWEKEAKKMTDYYANAYLTVAAASSVDDLSGCFTLRNVNAFQSSSVVVEQR